MSLVVSCSQAVVSWFGSLADLSEESGSLGIDLRAEASEPVIRLDVLPDDRCPKDARGFRAYLLRRA